MHLLSVWNPAYADDALNTHASLLRPLVREALAADDWDRQSVDLGRFTHLSLNDLARAIGADRERIDVLRKKRGTWFAEQLPPILDDLRQARNLGAHSTAVSREVATVWRNRICGVGSRGWRPS